MLDSSEIIKVGRKWRVIFRDFSSLEEAYRFLGIRNRTLKTAQLMVESPEVYRPLLYQMDGLLRYVLSDIDPFWMRWRYTLERLGVEPNYEDVDDEARRRYPEADPTVRRKQRD